MRLKKKRERERDALHIRPLISRARLNTRAQTECIAYRDRLSENRNSIRGNEDDSLGTKANPWYIHTYIYIYGRKRRTVYCRRTSMYLYIYIRNRELERTNDYICPFKSTQLNIHECPENYTIETLESC